MTLYYRRGGVTYPVTDYASEGPGWVSLRIRRSGTTRYIPMVTNLSHTYASHMRVRRGGATYAVLREAGCTCNATCYGYSACSCNNTCYGFSCSCNATCYGYSACSCYNTCYSYDSKTCGCYNTCYGHSLCTCNVTCNSYSACSCNATCYGYSACSCNNTCYVYGT